MMARFAADRRVTAWALFRLGGAAAAVIMLSSVALCAGAEGADKVSLQSYDAVQAQEFSWGWIRWLMNSQVDPDAEMTLGLVHIEPNQSNPLHVHPNCAEYLHVLAGSCEHRLGDRWVTLKAGDTLRIPKGAVHMARTKDKPCRVMVVYDTGTRQMVVVSEDE